MFLPVPGVLAPDKLKQMEIAQEVFLILLDRFNQSNRTVSDKSGANYAPARFVEEEEAKKTGLSKEVLKPQRCNFIAVTKYGTSRAGSRRDQPIASREE